MGKMIKPLVVILLLLSITALVLGCLLFAKRELLKARTQRLEKGIEDIAKTIRYEEYNEKKQSFNKQALVIDHKDKLPRLEKPLKDVALAGDLLYEDLQNTKEDLARTIEELNRTKEMLAQTRAELEQTKQEVVRLNGELDAANNEIAQLREANAQLESEKEAMQSTIDDLNNTIVEKDEQLQEKSDQLIDLEETIKQLEAELGPDPTHVVPKGLKGKIVALNPFWNFVVIDIGLENDLVAGTDMLVHRDDRLIGKIRITNVKDNMSIGDIVNDWEQSPIREGDDVLF